MKKENIRNELKILFKDNLNIEIKTKEHEEKELFGLNSPFTPAKATYLFALIMIRYETDLSHIVERFAKKITFSDILNYIYEYSPLIE